MMQSVGVGQVEMMESVSALQSSSLTLTSPLQPPSEQHKSCILVFHTHLSGTTYTTWKVNVKVVLQERQNVWVAVSEAVGQRRTQSAETKSHQTCSTAKLQDMPGVTT